MDMRKVKEFTGKVGAEFMSFLLEDDTLHSAYYSHVEVVMDNGKKMLCIKDDTGLKGIGEGQTRAEAITKAKAKVFLKRQQEKQRAASKG
ncbi:hypothetical protein CN558_23260 [Bacillus wiedmannii]|uniref:hypothetical protein n=1 Tax=Bacillus wiedmannii TaxID=1890302 RepID=UPI000BF1D662|nr:hypothetical protein [Bacillus wiedmannii]PEL75343.1 hypothetical protein CN609_28000 [Bacillus wiedmannii]PEM85326.1 hypothetical protein CN627_20450 [Bacillus wiedmannii]PEO82619.1 hypothetical protein CN558_23260 [Bacillus wiedmannii]